MKYKKPQNPEEMLQEFLERLEKKTAEELLADIKKAREDSWIMEDEAMAEICRTVKGDEPND